MNVTTINIAFTSDDWRGVALSNFTLSPFVLDGILLASIEGFIQGIKYPEGVANRDRAFVSAGWEAKALGREADRRGAYWGGQRVDYGSTEHQRLIERALRARFAQNEGLQHVLRSTAGLTIQHITGDGPEPATTSLSAIEFCRIMTTIRDDLLVQ
ncbi:hypothetical protein KVP09_15490 [Alcaligenaceae bacterium CGII-47]|nr:hypothetical protein [Alcaligenaceae bacterium CGII-47]